MSGYNQLYVLSIILCLKIFEKILNSKKYNHSFLNSIFKNIPYVRWEKVFTEIYSNT